VLKHGQEGRPISLTKHIKSLVAQGLPKDIAEATAKVRYARSRPVPPAEMESRRVGLVAAEKHAMEKRATRERLKEIIQRKNRGIPQANDLRKPEGFQQKVKDLGLKYKSQIEKEAANPKTEWTRHIMARRLTDPRRQALYGLLGGAIGGPAVGFTIGHGLASTPRGARALGSTGMGRGLGETTAQALGIDRGFQADLKALLPPSVATSAAGALAGGPAGALVGLAVGPPLGALSGYAGTRLERSLHAKALLSRAVRGADLTPEEIGVLKVIEKMPKIGAASGAPLHPWVESIVSPEFEVGDPLLVMEAKQDRKMHLEALKERIERGEKLYPNESRVVRDLAKHLQESRAMRTGVQMGRLARRAALPAAALAAGGAGLYALMHDGQSEKAAQAAKVDGGRLKTIGALAGIGAAGGAALGGQFGLLAGLPGAAIGAAGGALGGATLGGLAGVAASRPISSQDEKFLALLQNPTAGGFAQMLHAAPPAERAAALAELRSTLGPFGHAAATDIERSLRVLQAKSFARKAALPTAALAAGGAGLYALMRGGEKPEKTAAMTAEQKEDLKRRLIARYPHLAKEDFRGEHAGLKARTALLQAARSGSLRERSRTPGAYMSDTMANLFGADVSARHRAPVRSNVAPAAPSAGARPPTPSGRVEPHDYPQPMGPVTKRADESFNKQADPIQRYLEMPAHMEKAIREMQLEDKLNRVNLPNRPWGDRGPWQTRLDDVKADRNRVRLQAAHDRAQPLKTSTPESYYAPGVQGRLQQVGDFFRTAITGKSASEFPLLEALFERR
jgi:hypothetical protein